MYNHRYIYCFHRDREWKVLQCSYANQKSCKYKCNSIRSKGKKKRKHKGKSRKQTVHKEESYPESNPKKYEQQQPCFRLPECVFWARCCVAPVRFLSACCLSVFWARVAWAFSERVLPERVSWVHCCLSASYCLLWYIGILCTLALSGNWVWRLPNQRLPLPSMKLRGSWEGSAHRTINFDVGSMLYSFLRVFQALRENLVVVFLS